MIINLILYLGFVISHDVEISKVDENSIGFPRNIKSNFIFKSKNKFGKSKIDLTNGDIKIGSSEQSFRVVFELGTADMWVYSALGDFKNESNYDHRKSSTYKDVGGKITIKYMAGQLTGALSSDTIHIGGLNVTGQVFGEMNQPEIFNDKFQGSVGLGLPKSDDKTTSIVYNMKKKGLIDRTVVGIYLAIYPRPGEISFGFTNSDHYSGHLKYFPVIGNGKWSLHLKETTFGHLKFESAEGYFDTGTTIILGPTTDVKKIHESIKAFYHDNNMYVNCKSYDNFPDLVFYIGSEKFVLGPKEYLLSSNYKEDMCIVQILSLGYMEKKQWIIGVIFLQKYYSAYDFNTSQIGLATSKFQNVGGLSIIVMLLTPFFLI